MAHGRGGDWRRWGGLAALILLAWALPAFARGTASHQPPRFATWTGPGPAPRAQAGASNPRRVTVLLLDMSGSMRVNDPDDIRCAAARTFVRLSRPGELVGLIGFNGRTATPWLSAPIEATADGQRTLDQILVGRCSGTPPAAATPMFDALDQASRQLAGAPGTGPRSAVLLTDGTPEPGGQSEIARIEQTLVPRFQARHWPIDTIALGTDDVDFTFLATIAGGTGGHHYDGSQGRRATAYNLLPAFVDVLRDEVGRSPGQDVAEQSAGPMAFTVTPFASHLDVVVVCATACPQVTLRTPTGFAVDALQPVASSPQAPQYGAVFSLDDPPFLRAGASLVPWTVSADGGGSIRVESLVDLRLDVALQPPPPPRQLGLPLTVLATVTEKDGAPHVDDALILAGSARRGPDGQAIPFSLARTAGARYEGTVTIPAGDQPGSYVIAVAALHDRGQEPLASGSSDVEVGLFPRPVLAGPAAATRWPGWVAAVYSLPLLDRFGGWALRGAPLTPTASVAGALLGPDGASYTKAAMVTAEVAGAGQGGPAVAAASSTGRGRFRLSFPAPRPGDYAITLHTGGAESFGQTVTTGGMVPVTVQDAALPQVLRAALVTAALAMLLLLLTGYVRFCIMRAPYGAWRLRTEDGEQRQVRLARQPGLLRAFLRRNRAISRNPRGLEFRFGYRSGITVRPRRDLGAGWTLENGGALPPGFGLQHRLRHGRTLYTILAPEDDEDWTWEHWARALARALGLPVRMPRRRRTRPRP
ncbi:MAG TPA: vWA domain-containing protein [Candidatus Dormibacteraeota bacterium]